MDRIKGNVNSIPENVYINNSENLLLPVKKVNVTSNIKKESEFVKIDNGYIVSSDNYLYKTDENMVIDDSSIIKIGNVAESEDHINDFQLTSDSKIIFTKISLDAKKILLYKYDLNLNALIDGKEVDGYLSCLTKDGGYVLVNTFGSDNTIIIQKYNSDDELEKTTTYSFDAQIDHSSNYTAVKENNLNEIVIYITNAYNVEPDDLTYHTILRFDKNLDLIQELNPEVLYDLYNTYDVPFEVLIDDNYLIGGINRLYLIDKEEGKIIKNYSNVNAVMLSNKYDDDSILLFSVSNPTLNDYYGVPIFTRLDKNGNVIWNYQTNDRIYMIELEPTIMIDKDLINLSLGYFENDQHESEYIRKLMVFKRENIIAIDKVENGKVTYEGSTKYNEKIKLNIIPDNEYMLYDLKIISMYNSKDITEEVKYDSKNKIFIMPNYDVKILSTFVKEKDLVDGKIISTTLTKYTSNPITYDNIIKYFIIGGIALVLVIGIIIYTKKKK